MTTATATATRTLNRTLLGYLAAWLTQNPADYAGEDWGFRFDGDTIEDRVETYSPALKLAIHLGCEPLWGDIDPDDCDPAWPAGVTATAYEAFDPRVQDWREVSAIAADALGLGWIEAKRVLWWPSTAADALAAINHILEDTEN